MAAAGWPPTPTWTAATQPFYLAQIEAAHAGKTMVIQLFDPGESSGDAFLRIKSPDGNAYNYANFTWTADDGRSGTADPDPDVDRRRGPVQQPADHDHDPAARRRTAPAG